MIRIIREFSILCDACGTLLSHPMTDSAYSGHTVTELNTEHIREVALSMGWGHANNKDLCDECKK